MSKSSSAFGVGQQAGSSGATKGDDRLCKDFGFVGLCFVSFSGHGSPMFADPPPDDRPSCRSPAIEHTFATGGNRIPCKQKESMKTVIVFALSALIVSGILAPAPASATPNVKFCGHAKSWTISAGKNPKKYPRTSCRFARSSYRNFVRFVRQNESLPVAFRLKVGGQKLRGSALPIGATLIVTLKNPRRFVQMTSPY